MNKSRIQIFYSIAVVLAIPILLAFNTLFLASNVRDDYDSELQSRAEIASSVLASAIEENLKSGNTGAIQIIIDDISVNQKELRNVTVIESSDNGYKILASQDANAELSNSDSLQYDIVFSRQWPVAKSIAIKDDDGRDARAWSVASPVIVDGSVIGIVSSDLLTNDVDEKFDATLSNSVVIMIVSTIAVTVLLINHFRFIGYASLLAKQKELNQTMSDFLSVATHELKAPMTIIKGYISNILDGDFGKVSEPIKEQLNVAVSQTDRLNSLVQDLLNVSRIEQGRIQFDIQPVELSELIDIIAKTYSPIATEKGLELVYEKSEDTKINADAGRMQEIFTNLIDNAVKYSESGTVTVSHNVTNSHVVTSVRDAGIGMTQEERKRLFHRFYRVQNEHTKGVQGTGLGLWIIKQYIEKMGGKIEVDSLAGAGTEFRVTFKKI
jgi:signal transduction histidine kinase